MKPTHHLPEALRNRLLRRVDWRFLLPNPAPQRSICFGDRLLKEAVTLISQETVPATRFFDAECDLAVAQNPTKPMLQTLWKTLRPGGACYIEWQHPLLGGARGARRRLTTLGFEQVTCYWPWPWPSRQSPLFWLPLEAPTALTYFLQNRPRAATRRQQLWQALARRLWQVSAKTPLIMPICAIARKPLRRGTTGQSEEFLPLWFDRNGGTAQPSTQLLLTGGQRSVNKVVSQVFLGNQAEPQLVVKQARVPESQPALLREAQILQTIQHGRAAGLSGVPQVRFCHQSPGLLAVGESVLRGEPIWTKMNSANYRQLALQATEWLVALAGEAPPRPPAEWWARLVAPPFQEFQQHFAPVITPKQVRATYDQLQQLSALPLICEHRDFSPWNVLLAAPDKLAVLDWESAELQGLPGLDLIYFLTYLTFFRDGAMASQRFVESYRAMLQPETATGAVFQECMAYYARQLRLDPNSLQRLRLLVWLIHARSEYQRLQAEAASPPAPHLLGQSLFMQLWQAEVELLPAP